MNDQVDFGSNDELELEDDIQDQGDSVQKNKKDSQETSDEPGIKELTEEKTDEVQFSDGAFTLFEDDNYLFTSEGVIEKSSLRKTGKENSVHAEPDEKTEKILGKFDNHEDLAKSYKELEKKLGDSSEAVNKLRELNPVLPMLEAMLGDDTFLQMAEEYFTNPEAQSQAFKKQLGIDDDFVFDLNSALSDPKSEDAKILNKLTQTRQQPTKSSQVQGKQKQSDPAERDAFMKKYGLSDAEYTDMMDKASGYTITHDDIYFLLNKEKVLKEERDKAEKAAQDAIKKQVGVAQTVRKSRSGGGEPPQESPEDVFMKSLSVGKGLFD